MARPHALVLGAAAIAAVSLSACAKQAEMLEPTAVVTDDTLVLAVDDTDATETGTTLAGPADTDPVVDDTIPADVPVRELSAELHTTVGVALPDRPLAVEATETWMNDTCNTLLDAGVITSSQPAKEYQQRQVLFDRTLYCHVLTPWTPPNPITLEEAVTTMQDAARTMPADWTAPQDPRPDDDVSVMITIRASNQEIDTGALWAKSSSGARGFARGCVALAEKMGLTFDSEGSIEEVIDQFSGSCYMVLPAGVTTPVALDPTAAQQWLDAQP